jgi:hypothetical protein
VINWFATCNFRDQAFFLFIRNYIIHLVRNEKYSRYWSSREPREIFSLANKSWFTVYGFKQQQLNQFQKYISTGSGWLQGTCPMHILISRKNIRVDKHVHIGTVSSMKCLSSYIPRSVMWVEQDFRTSCMNCEDTYFVDRTRSTPCKTKNLS